MWGRPSPLQYPTETEEQADHRAKEASLELEILLLPGLRASLFYTHSKKPGDLPKAAGIWTQDSGYWLSGLQELGGVVAPPASGDATAARRWSSLPRAPAVPCRTVVTGGRP